MTTDNVEYEEREQAVISLLTALQDVPERDLHSTEKGKALYMNQAIQLDLVKIQAVSQKPKARHIGWNYLFTLIKERKTMSALVTMFLVVLLAIGGSGVTAFAAQSSLPDQPLYEIKLASEDARYGWTFNQQARFQMALKYADRRVEEIVSSARGGKDISSEVQARWEKYIESAFQLAVGMEADQQEVSLGKIRERLMIQERLLAGVKDSQPNDAVIQQIQHRIQDRIIQCENALGIEQRKQEQFQNGKPDDAGGPNSVESPAPNSGNAPSLDDNICGNEDPLCEPASGENSKNPWTDEPPVPGSGYGPGDGDGTCDGCDQEGTGPGPVGPGEGDHEGAGPGPVGPGDGTCDGCNQDGNGDGPHGPGENFNPEPGKDSGGESGPSSGEGHGGSGNKP